MHGVSTVRHEVPDAGTPSSRRSRLPGLLAGRGCRAPHLPDLARVARSVVHAPHDSRHGAGSAWQRRSLVAPCESRGSRHRATTAIRKPLRHAVTEGRAGRSRDARRPALPDAQKAPSGSARAARWTECARSGRTPRTRSARAGRLWTPHRRVVVREQRRRRVAPGPWGTPPRKIRGLRPRLAGDRRPTASGRRSSSGRRLLSRAALDRGSGSRGNPSAVGSLRHDQAARARAGDQRSHHPLPRSARRSSARSSRRPAPKLASGRRPEAQKPLRAELLSIERLEERARALAASFTLARDPRRKARPFFSRLEDNARVLRKAYRVLADDVHGGEFVPPAAEWLLDNFHLIEAEIRGIRHDLPRHYYLDLPKLASREMAGIARVYAMALELIRHTDGRLDRQQLVR